MPVKHTRPRASNASRPQVWATSSTMWVDSSTVRVRTDVRQQGAEVDAFLRVAADGGLVDDEQLGVAEQRLGDADAPFMPPDSLLSLRPATSARPTSSSSAVTSRRRSARLSLPLRTAM